MKPFQHKQLVALYRLQTIRDGEVVNLADNLSWDQAICIQERIPRVSIRFSHHEERLIPEQEVQS